MILKEEQKELLRQIIEDDEKSGLYTVPPAKVYVVIRPEGGYIYGCFTTREKAMDYAGRDAWIKELEVL